jgi:hypothetical protein
MNYFLKFKVVGIVLGAIFGMVTVACFYMVYLSWFDVRAPAIELTYSHPTAVQAGAKSRDEIKDAISIHAGGTFYVFREWCVLSPFIQIDTRRFFVGQTDPSEIYSMPAAQVRADSFVGCVGKAFANVVPAEIPPGRYFYRASTIYMIKGNPLGTWVFEWPDVDVNVVKAL